MSQSTAHLVRILRAADPLPAPGDLEHEIAEAIARTRSALVRDNDATLGSSGSTIRPRAAFTSFEAPWGEILLAAGDRGLLAIELRSSRGSFVESLADRLGGPVVTDQDGLPEGWRSILDRARHELTEYFAGRRRSFDVPVDLLAVSAWDRLVLDGARSLHFGQVTSYGRLARAIGRPGAARAVGGALGRNPVPIVVPCHRVLAADGSIGGYGGGGHGSRLEMLGVKQALLGLEGVRLPAVALAG